MAQSFTSEKQGQYAEFFIIAGVMGCHTFTKHMHHRIIQTKFFTLWI